MANEPQPKVETKPGTGLVAKLAWVMAGLKHVPKRGRNQFHGYDYATEADIADAVRQGLAEQGVMIFPSVDKLEWREIDTKSGKQAVAILHVKFTVTDGTDSREFTMIGEGQDSGDKATYKAMTGAQKYALVKLFLMSTGDDPEADSAQDAKPATPSPAKPAAPAARPAPSSTGDWPPMPPREPDDDVAPGEGNVAAMPPPCPKCSTVKKVIRSRYAGPTWRCLECKVSFGPTNSIPKEVK